VKNNLVNKLKLDNQKVLLMPLFPKIKNNNIGISYQREKHTYLYVSNAQSNKNHIFLIDAFCSFYNKYNFGKLILTVSENYTTIFNYIVMKQNAGYPIINHGFVDRNDLLRIYSSAEYFIYPSVSESFGLGLIESIECGCKVIGADLPYTFDVCNPSIIFNPFKIKSIENAFEKSISNVPVEKSILKTNNSIDKFIDLFKNK
jgi:glycosyltransferase involved in cell wall biosynthesis